MSLSSGRLLVTSNADTAYLFRLTGGLATGFVMENAPVGTLAGTLSGTDADERVSLTYTLVAGSGDADNAAFTIVGNEVRTVQSFDREATATRLIRVRVTDSEGGTFEKQLTIEIGDVNEAPLSIALSSSTAAENQAVNATVGTLSSTDADAGNLFSYSLISGTGSDDNASFTIVGNELQTSASFHF